MRCLYRGVRTESGCLVYADEQPLDPRLDLWSHSPTGFEWGYGGSGPAQLALALLAHHLQDDARAVSLHQHFKRDFVAGLPHEDWFVTSDFLAEWVTEAEAEGGADL
jgi:Family of unknown function (DUF6166)